MPRRPLSGTVPHLFVARAYAFILPKQRRKDPSQSLELSVLSEQSIFKRDCYCYCSVLSKSALHYLSSRSPWLLCDMCSAPASICQTLPRSYKERDGGELNVPISIPKRARERGGQDVIVASSFSSACVYLTQILSRSLAWLRSRREKGFRACMAAYSEEKRRPLSPSFLPSRSLHPAHSE